VLITEKTLKDTVNKYIAFRNESDAHGRIDNAVSGSRCVVSLAIHIIFSRVLVTKTGFGLVIGFINNPQVVTTTNSYTVTNLHTLKSLHTNLFSLSAIVFTHSKYCT
jgi:hypothetical protein